MCKRTFAFTLAARRIVLESALVLDVELIASMFTRKKDRTKGPRKKIIN